MYCYYCETPGEKFRDKYYCNNSTCVNYTKIADWKKIPLIRIDKFLKANGWESGEKDEFQSYFKDNNIGVDVSNDYIVLVGGSGDFAGHDLKNSEAIFWLLGRMLECKALAMDYKSPLWESRSRSGGKGK